MLEAGKAFIRSFRVVPDLPPTLRPLLELAHNLWWTWHPEAVALFRRLDRDLWEETRHNPVKMLGSVNQGVLDKVAEDRSYLHALSLVHARFMAHMERTSWFQRAYPEVTGGAEGDNQLRVAYFCAEFGLTKCLQIYSGGLGCLAGDHLKAASELGLPMCAVGLLYRCGYFHQYLNADGWQQETYPDLDFPNQPIRRLIDPATGEQYRVQVELPGRNVTIGVWQLDAGRIPVYLLDTNFPENSREDRDITRTLYGGDIETRIKQEIVLGIGGVRALAKIGQKANVFHINEGHAAFLALERIAQIREKYAVGFDEAREAAAAAHLFTTHTPVPAGIDRFAPELIERYLAPLPQRLGIDFETLKAMGRVNVFDPQEHFSMAVLAIRTSQFCNGVSALHGQVSRKMWAAIWPGLPEPEIPIGHVTNGCHPRSWISPQLMGLYDRFLGPDWQLDPMDHDIWKAVNDIPDEEIWRLRQRQREKLITWCRRKIRRQLTARGAGHDEIERAANALDPNALTIGFARRFATYKRGTLFMSDLDRLRALLSDEKRPVQILVSGKAHPADGAGKELIREIVRASSQPGPLRRVVFLEDYDMDIARRLVQGCDMWLNNPKRWMEASGTSGMKAAMNGVINVSILDGWWDEAYDPSIGFAIGKGESYEDEKQQDAIESRALYDLLERQIVPEFYDRDESGLPQAWIARIKRCLRKITPRFSTIRMAAEYAETYYLPAFKLSARLMRDNLAEAKDLAQHIRRLREHWHRVAIRRVSTDVGSSIAIRRPVHVRAEVELGGLSPDEVRVQLYHGEVTSLGDLVDCAAIDMRHDPQRQTGGEGVVFTGEYEPGASGRRGFTVRVLPRDDRLVGTAIPGLIVWQNTPTIREGETTWDASTNEAGVRAQIGRTAAAKA